MAQPVPSELPGKEQSIELFISNLLRVCVALTVAIVGIGAALFLPGQLSHVAAYSHFVGVPAGLNSVTGILQAALSGDGKAIVQSGLLLLILTPLLRVLFSVLAFLFERDHLYVVITLVVLGLLTFSLAGG